MKIKNGYITLQTPDGEMEVYFSHPGRMKNPALIIFQEAFGVNDHIKDVCHRFANEGYFVVSPELYHRGGKNLEFPYGSRSGAMTHLKALTEENILTDTQAVLDMLYEVPKVDSSKIATVGFCIGGYASVLAATNFDLSGSIAFYGAGMMREREDFKLKPIKNKFKKISAPLLLFFGQDDASIPMYEVHQIQETLEKEGKAFRSVVFKDSDHGFFCNQRKSYNQLAAEDAWSMSLEFLEEVFSSPTHSLTDGSVTLPSEGVKEFKSSVGPLDASL